MEKDKLVAVKWYDACERTLDHDIFRTFDYIKSGKEFLAINITYGKILAIFDEVILIAMEDSDTKDTQTTIVPRGWIIEPKELKKGTL